MIFGSNIQKTLYMMESCTQTADVVSRQHMRSASQRKMIVLRYRLDSGQLWSTGPQQRNTVDHNCVSVFRCCGPVDLEFAARQSS